MKLIFGVLLVAILYLPLSVEGSDRIEIIKTKTGDIFSQFALQHVDEKSSWKGVFCQGIKCWVDTVEMKIDIMKDVIHMSKNGSEAGKVVKLNTIEEPPFMIRGLTGLKDGPIKVWRKKVDLSDKKAIVVLSKEEADPYRIAFIPEVKVKYGAATAKITAFLSQGDITQKIIDSEGWGVPRALYGSGLKLNIESEIRKKLVNNIIWSGDLDGDSNPDFVIDESLENGIRLILLLSTLSEINEFVRPDVPFNNAIAKFHYWDPNDPGDH